MQKTTKLKKLEEILLFLTLLFLPTQLGKHFWPTFSYIYSLKIDYLSPTVYFWDLLAVTLLLVWVLTRPKINKVALNLFFLFLLSQALSLFSAANLGAGLVRMEQYGVAGLFGVFLASSDFNSLRKKIYLPLALGILTESVLAILQFVKGGHLGFWILGERAFSITTPAIAKFDFQGRQLLRPYATFPHPNVLAGFLLLGISVLYQLLKERKILISLVSILGGVAVFLAMSRTVILAGIVLVAVLLKRNWLILIGIALLVVSPVLFTRFASILNFDNLTLLRREQLIGNAWEIFLKSPVFGTGLNSFIPTISSTLLTGPSRFLQPVHNIFMLSLAETGLVGFFGLLFLIGYPIWKMYKVKFTMYNSLPWFIIIFLGMFDHYFLTLPQGYRLLFLVWGLSFSFLALHSNTRS
ncbi:O-antigen ligase family protein [Candidatus Daviesbacteria bacterium]|nr:O-antigen ligase family protein [Candidatus Daviesbacteria bacterium]